MRIAYADCYSGISGDMFLAALLDAGLPLETLRAGIDALHLPETVDLRAAETHKGALRAMGLDVVVADSEGHRHLSDILSILDASSLSDRVKSTAELIFRLVAEAEARVHGEPVEEVHFHEVGALDSIVDIVGAAIGIEALGIERLYASPLPYGRGAVETQHGRLPLPAPATLELMTIARAPLVPSPAEVELITPTGAAILAALATFEQPSFVPERVGIGAGKRELPWPNVFRLIVGDATEAGDLVAGSAPVDASAAAEPMVQLETNIDDMNPQFYGLVMERLFAAGARDVFLVPIQMKKNRPATLLGVIAAASDEAALADLILRETTTLGIRVHPIRRYEAERASEQIETAYGTLRVKRKIVGGNAIQAVPEYDDCVRLADQHGVRLADIYEAAREALATEKA